MINSSKRAFSESEISVLSKGLKFVMTPKELDYSQINPLVVGLFDSSILVGGAKKPPPPYLPLDW